MRYIINSTAAQTVYDDATRDVAMAFARRCAAIGGQAEVLCLVPAKSGSPAEWELVGRIEVEASKGGQATAYHGQTE